MINPFLTSIVCVDENNLIGIGDAIPWHCKTDMQHFAKHTHGNRVVMGGNTLQSLIPYFPDRELLQGRRKSVIVYDETHKNTLLGMMTAAQQVNLDFYYSHGNLKQSMNEMSVLAQDEYQDEGIITFLIGGAFMYKALLPYTRSVILNRLQINADTSTKDCPPEYKKYFPSLDLNEWNETLYMTEGVSVALTPHEWSDTTSNCGIKSALLDSYIYYRK